MVQSLSGPGVSLETCRAASAYGSSVGPWPNRTAYSSPSATRAGGLAQHHLRGDVARRQRHCPVAARPRAGTGPPAADPGRQRHRSWPGGLGALHVGVPVVPVSTPYARLSQDHAKLRYIFDLIKPGMIYVDEADRYAKALRSHRRGARTSEVVASRGSPARTRVTPFATLTDGAADAGGRGALSRASGPIRSPRSSSPPARPASPRE